MKEEEKPSWTEIFFDLIQLVCIVLILYFIIADLPGIINNGIQEAKDLKDNVTLIKNQNQKILDTLSKKSS